MKKIYLIGLLLLLPVRSEAQVGAAPNGGVVIVASPYSGSTTYTSNKFCLDNTNQDVYIARVGANDLGIYTNATACASGTLKFDVSATLTTSVNSIQSNSNVFLAGYISNSEIADPTAPATNFGLIYFKDTGGGKTTACVRFPTGAVQCFATEP